MFVLTTSHSHGTLIGGLQVFVLNSYIRTLIGGLKVFVLTTTHSHGTRIGGLRSKDVCLAYHLHGTLIHGSFIPLGGLRVFVLTSYIRTLIGGLRVFVLSNSPSHGTFIGGLRVFVLSTSPSHGSKGERGTYRGLSEGKEFDVSKSRMFCLSSITSFACLTSIQGRGNNRLRRQNEFIQLEVETEHLG